MSKYIKFTIALAALASVWGCDSSEDTNASNSSEDTNALKLMCETQIQDKSVCENIASVYQILCYEKLGTDDNAIQKCSNAIDEFSLACITSGGSFINGENKYQCECNGIKCREGSICDNTPTHACMVELTCVENTEICKNTWSEKGIVGEMYICQQGNYIKSSSCGESSCTFKNDALNEGTDEDPGICGKCINTLGTQSLCINDPERHVGMTQICRNGNYDFTDCPNLASCSMTDEIESICGECKNDDIQCAGETEYQVCDNGKWKDAVSCPGKATCSDNKCNDADLTACTGADGDMICQNGKELECIQGKYTSGTSCENSDGCKDDKTCGTCKATDSKCNNKPNVSEGSLLLKCENYDWSATTTESDYSCKNAAEVGECTNGFYKYSQTDGNKQKTADIQICMNGLWPKDIASWPYNPNNDSLYNHVANCTNDTLTLYSNYNNHYVLYLKESNGCSNINSDTVQGLSEDSGYIIHGVNNSHYSIEAFIKAFYNADSKAPWFYSQSSNQYLWFNCSKTWCGPVTLCIDTLVSNDSNTDNIHSKTYLVEFNQSATSNIKFTSSDLPCNSNKTDITGNCTQYAIDMTHRYHTDTELSKQELSFDICKLGYKRSVSCKNSGDNYSCIIKPQQKAITTDEGAGFTDTTSPHICIDFYDSNFGHTAYRFANTSPNNQDTFTLTETITNPSAKYMIKCPSNLCNENWSDCMCLDSKGNSCKCNESLSGCEE
ncbi:MAG: hypothetical protein J6A01_09635 [Proteobacteria bacterium]|nr:hypothetical protein [Pseudomonadota bacterium]